jgi:hypothetical protein
MVVYAVALYGIMKAHDQCCDKINCDVILALCPAEGSPKVAIFASQGPTVLC